MKMTHNMRTHDMRRLLLNTRRLKEGVRRLNCDMRRLRTETKSSGMMCCLADHGKNIVTMWLGYGEDVVTIWYRNGEDTLKLV